MRLVLLYLTKITSYYMSPFIKDFYTSTIKVVKSFAWIPLLVLGIVLIIISELSPIKIYSALHKGLHTGGISIISSAIFITIVKSRQFSEIFHTQLKDIIYCTGYLKNRKDIRDLWLKTSKALYEESFPELCDTIEENLEEYIPIDSRKYYENYSYKIDISFDEKESDFINLEERETFDLITRDKEEMDYKSSCIFNKVDYNDKYSTYKLKTFKVNNKDEMPTSKQLTKNFKYKGKKVLIVHNRSFKGSNRYKFEKEELKRYSLKVENTKSHSCQHIFKNYTLEVTHPEDLEVAFYENGTLNNFKVIPIRTVGNCKVQRFEYEGIMFKNQGIRLIFRDLRK